MVGSAGRNGPDDGAAAVAPSVVRKPYGHFGGAITLAVRTADGQPAPPEVAPVLDDAVDDWHGHLSDYAAEAGLRAFDRWAGRVRALVLPETRDGPVVVAAGRAAEWRYDDAKVIPWHALRTVATAAARHLGQAGWGGARVVKPKAATLPARIHQAPDAVILRAIERRATGWDDAGRVKGALVEVARRWVERAGGPVYASLGQYPVSLAPEALDPLVDLVVDLDVHVDLAAGSARRAVAYGSLGWREFALGWGGRGVSPEERLARAEELAEVLAAEAGALDYGCISFDPQLFPIYRPAGARGWCSPDLSARDAAGSVALDAFWAQLLTRDHLAAAPAAAADAHPVDGGRAVLRIGRGDEWVDPPARDERREAGRALLAGCLVDDETMTRQGHPYQEWREAQPRPQDDPPDWALPVAPPAGFTRTQASYTPSLVDHGHGEFDDWFTGPQECELRVTQTAPGEGPSAGNPWIEIAPGFRVQVVDTDPQSVSAAVFWSERGRTFHVYVSDSRAVDLRGVVVALHYAAAGAQGT